MKWFKKSNYENMPKFPEIEDVSVEIPAISEYLEAFRLPDLFKTLSIDTLPVIDTQGNIVGIVSEYDLAQILPEWTLEEESYRHNITVADIMTKNVWIETEHTNIKDLFSKIHQMHTRVIPIVDENGRYTGSSITRTALVSFLTGKVKPRSLGGLATPLGVYLTDGRHQAGAGNLGLLLTGISMAGIAILAQLITNIIYNYIAVPELLAILIQLTLFILILRVTPLVRYHAAEHQTIHAIEKGLPLTVDTVKMQPRPHPRCGTNIMILFIGIQVVLIFSYQILKFMGSLPQFLFLAAGLIFVLSNWRKMGMWLQKYLTTATASDKQIESAIKVGDEILKKHKNNTGSSPPAFLEKAWNMGIIQVLSGFLLTLWLFGGLAAFID